MNDIKTDCGFTGKFLDSRQYGRVSIFPDTVKCGSCHAFTLTYTAGSKGIDRENGLLLHFCGSPTAWKLWQTDNPAGASYATARAKKKGVELEVDIFRPPKRRAMHFVRVKLVQGEITEGDQIEIELGDRNGGGSGTNVLTVPRTLRIACIYGIEMDPVLELAQEDPGHFCCYASPREIENSPRINIIPAPPVRLRLYAPSVARPGKNFELLVNFCDEFGNPSILTEEYKGFLAIGNDIIQVKCAPGTDLLKLPAILMQLGIHRLTMDFNGQKFESNPVLCDKQATPIHWGDLHVHSYYSDGIGEPRRILEFGRDKLGLKFMSICDHADNLSSPIVPATGEIVPDKPQALADLSSELSEEGRFISFQSYEWCGRGGDRIVYTKDPVKLPVYHRRKPGFYDCKVFLDAVRSHPELIIASHPHNRKTDWSYFDGNIEYFVEIASIHCRSEYNDPFEMAADLENISPHAEHRFLHKNSYGSVQTAWQRGCILGCIASSDAHYGCVGRDVGIPGKFAPTLCAIKSPEVTRDLLWENLLSRHTYGTTGARIIILFDSEELTMGDVGELRNGCKFNAEVHGTSGIAFVDLVKNNIPVKRVTGADSGGQHYTSSLDSVTRSPAANNGIKDLRLEYTDDFCDSSDFNWYYIRVHQHDGSIAWSSPIWRLKDKGSVGHRLH